jgi:hypothetical protein
MSRLDAVLTSFGCARIAAADVTGFAHSPGTSVLFFSGREGKYDEADDVAVALRELMRSQTGIDRAAALASSEETAIMKQFGVATAPSLLFLRDGKAIGQIPRIKTWAAYRDRAAAILCGQDNTEEANDVA